MAAAAIALALGRQWALLSPLLVAMVLGAVAGNTLRSDDLARWCSQGAAKTMLRLGIVLLGLRISFSQLADLGVRGLLVIAVTVLGVWSLTLWLGRRLGIAEDLTQLIAAGFSICGAAAIAAVQDGVRATQRHVAVAVALVTLFGTAMIGLIPLVSDLLGLSQQQRGVWAGASIHEVAQVVATGSLLGTSALTIAVTVKLGRVLMLAPVHLLAVRSSGPVTDRLPVLPWFVTGFLGAVAVRSALNLPSDVLDTLDVVATLLLGAGMFGLGAGIVLRTLLPLPWRVVGLATTATGVAGLIPLIGVAVLW